MTRTATSVGGPRARYGDDGFTLIESLVAAVILLVAAVGVIMTLTTTAGWYAQASTRTQASAVAQQVLSLIRARDVGQLTIDPNAGAGSFPASIPSHWTTTTPSGSFAVTASIVPTIDPSTQLSMLKISVIVGSLGTDIGSPVVATAYTSGANGGTSEPYVPVRVRCVPAYAGAGPLTSAGIPVWLVDADTAQIYSAYTDGNNYAYFDQAPGDAQPGGHGQLVPASKDGYWLTIEQLPGFVNPFVHAMSFPVRVYPAAGGSANNPVLALNSYSIDVSPVDTGKASAALDVGVFSDNGVDPMGNRSSSGAVEGLVVYAAPNLADTQDPGAGSDSGYYYGYGASTRYGYTGLNAPPYKGTVYTDGVAVIQIPFPIDPARGQTWTVWFHTRDGGGNLITRSTVTSAPGHWSDDPAYQASTQEGASIDTTFTQVVGTAVNDPNPTQ